MKLKKLLCMSLRRMSKINIPIGGKNYEQNNKYRKCMFAGCNAAKF